MLNSVLNTVADCQVVAAPLSELSSRLPISFFFYSLDNTLIRIMPKDQGSDSCNPAYAYYNLLITVPDRTGRCASEATAACALHFDTLFPLKAGEWARVVREPYSKALETGETHHFHYGLCFKEKRRFMRAVTKSKGTPFFGAHFDFVQCRRGSSAREVFTKYFDNPSKYKALDTTGGILIPVVPPLPPPPQISDENFLTHPRRQRWGEEFIHYMLHPGHSTKNKIYT